MFKFNMLCLISVLCFILSGMSCIRPHDIEIRNATDQLVVGYFYETDSLKTPFVLNAKDKLVIKNAVWGFVGDKYIFIYSLNGKKHELEVTIKKFAPESFIVNLGMDGQDKKNGQ